ncbi:MAG: sugar-binding protein, partial [Cyclobacteriaceae bacterium]
MTKKYSPILKSLVAVIITALLACQPMDMKTYTVKKTTAPVRLTGQGTDPAWNNAEVLTDFTYPWRDEVAPSTTFKGLWDDTYFYFLYRAVDPDIVTKERGLGERDAVDSDRVEIFFKADD